ncbi:MAG TPA: cupredoxin domain-containing protein [Rhizomicrobium sp.]|nr:cupredoxin domain-containing protein [Rhizomicrobium sp.]
MQTTFFAFVLVLAGASAAAAADATVTIKNFQFAMDVTVTSGSTVTWTNLDGEPHTVASIDGLFRSPALDQNDSFRFTFDKPGTYKYICSIHPRMKAVITVK